MLYTNNGIALRCYVLFFLTVMLLSCIEEIDLQTEAEFESALVIEAIITDEFKPQEIKLSRTFKLDDSEQVFESGATVKVLENGSVHDFFESEPGVYLSSNNFAAQSNTDYQLEITTNEGKLYKSSSTQLTTSAEIDELYFERGFNENNEEGVSVFVDSFDPLATTKFYRFTYEETYKIVAPRYSPLDLEVDVAPPDFILVPKPVNLQVCYSSEKSNTIILENTNLLEEDRLSKFRVHFLNRDNYIISHRYSILVKQFVQTSDGHEYYSKLNELSTNDNVLSQLQPGFLNGNIYFESNREEKVIGFFEVSSVDVKRIYFNYNDLFPAEPLPPYAIGCTEFAPLELNMGGGSPLLDALSQGNKYYSDNGSPMEGEGAYNLVAPACGDCTVLGTLDPPSFWIE